MNDVDRTMLEKWQDKPVADVLLKLHTLDSLVNLLLDTAKTRQGSKSLLLAYPLFSGALRKLHELDDIIKPPTRGLHDG